MEIKHEFSTLPVNLLSDSCICLGQWHDLVIRSLGADNSTSDYVLQNRTYASNWIPLWAGLADPQSPMAVAASRSLTTSGGPSGPPLNSYAKQSLLSSSQGRGHCCLALTTAQLSFQPLLLQSVLAKIEITTKSSFLQRGLQQTLPWQAKGGSRPALSFASDCRSSWEVNPFLCVGLIQKGGVMTSLYNSSQQWDAPNAWPPLQYFSVEGLDNYGGKACPSPSTEPKPRINQSIGVHLCLIRCSTDKMTFLRTFLQVHKPSQTATKLSLDRSSPSAPVKDCSIR